MKNIFIICFTVVITTTISAQSYRGLQKTISPEERLNAQYCNGLFQSAEGTIIDATSLPEIATFRNVLDWLTGRVAGLQIYRTWNGGRIPVIRGGVPGIFIDEIPVSASTLDIINVNDIAMVKIIRQPFFGGINGGNGAIAIYTKDGSEEEEE
jgi:hypothetical protein